MIARAALALLALAAVYGVFGFVKAEFNAWEWSEEARAHCAVFALFAAGMAASAPWRLP